MGTYKTNWQLTETVMPEDFNRIESNIKENNKNHTDFKTENDKTLKEQNKKIDAKSEKSDVLLKVPYPADRDCNSFKSLNSFFAFDTSIGDFKNTPEGNLAKGSSKVFIVTNRGYSSERIQQEWVSIYPHNSIVKYTRNLISGEWGNWYKAYDEANKPTWSDVTGKPSTFTPSTHNHDDRYYTESEADGRFLGKNAKASSANIADKVEWNNVANKPSNFTPSPHEHNYIGDSTIKMYAHKSNEINFGGGFRDNRNMYFGYSEIDGRPVPLAYVFGKDGNAEVKAKDFYASGNKVYHQGNKPSWNDINNKPNTFAPNSHNHDDRYFTESESDGRYFRNNVGDVTDFNTATTIGRYYVYKDNGSIPNAPVTGNIYGALEVFRTNNSELMQRFTGIDGKIFTRLRNYSNTWLPWKRTTTVEEFACLNNKSSGYQKLPGGIIIQWGSNVINFTSSRGSGYLNYPVAFSSYCHVIGNVGTNDYGGYSETSGTVQGDNLSRAYAEVINISGNNVAGKQARVNWIAIGI